MPDKIKKNIVPALILLLLCYIAYNIMSENGWLFGPSELPPSPPGMPEIPKDLFKKH